MSINDPLKLSTDFVNQNQSQIPLEIFNNLKHNYEQR